MEVKGIVTCSEEPKLYMVSGISTGDGDSAPYSNVIQDESNFLFEKKECVGHSRREWDKTEEIKNINVGKGRLAQAVINEMKLYHGLAIRRNMV